MNLPGHFSCIWSLDVPFDGSFCVSASQDRSMRIWKRTEDLVFIEEERERAFEAQVETAATNENQNENLTQSNENQFSAVGSLQTIESVKVNILEYHLSNVIINLY